MKKLYKHQQRFIDKNPDHALLVWEGGTGKSLAAIRWLKNRPKRKGLVVCPKAIVDKWRRDLEEEGVKATVLSRDAVKVSDISKYEALVLDEAQDFASPLFSKQRSARATKIYEHIKKYPNTHVLLLTATPVRSTPWNIHTLACYLGKYWDIKRFRDTFEYMTDKFGRMHYELRSDWRKKVRPYVESISDIVLMQDCIDVPVQHHKVVTVPWTEKQESELNKKYLEPSSEWHERHRAENGEEKLLVLKKLTDQYRKSIVVCHYTEQIRHYSEELGKDRQVFVLEGATKNQDEIIQSARESDDCIFIIQAQMGAGFDAAEFSVVIFASMSFRYVDYVQMKFRVKRINNLHENLFIHLLGGENDEAIYDTIQKGHDFNPHEYLKHNAKEK
jgi:superfamily II DNA or RNA helicase